ncbi:hypothetical protein Tco_0175061 [Tanacetum coccineum]
MGNEPILAFPEGPDDFVVYYDAQSKDLEAGLEKREGDCWLTNRWLSMKKVIASCGSKCLAYLEVEVEYQGSSGLLLQPELPILWAITGEVELKWITIFGVMGGEGPPWGGKLSIHTCLLSKESLGVLVEVRGHEQKRNMIVLVKVHWDSKRGPEFTWERKDQMRSKCPQLFVDSANASSS